MKSLNDLENTSNQELEERATCLRNNGQIADAVKIYEELVKRFDKSGDLKHAANMQHMIGVSYGIANKKDGALSALIDAKQRYEQAGDEVGIGRALRDEASVNHKQAMSLLKQSVEILEKYNNPAELGISQAKLGDLYLKQGDLASAENWIKRGLKTLVNTDHWFYTATSRMYLSMLHLKNQKYDDALEEVEESKKQFMDHDGESTNIRRLAQIEAIKSLIYLRKNNPETAQKHRESCERMLEKLDSNSANYIRQHSEFREIFQEIL